MAPAKFASNIPLRYIYLVLACCLECLNAPHAEIDSGPFPRVYNSGFTFCFRL